MAVVVGAAGFVAVGLAVRHSANLTGWELDLVSAGRRFPPPWSHTWISAFDREPFAGITLALGGLALLRRRWSLAVSGTLGCVVAVYVTEHVAKKVFEDSYPSAHVTAAAACAMFAWLILYKRRPFALVVFVVPLVVAWAAIAERFHRPGDVVGGLLFGPVVVAITVAAFIAGVAALSAQRRLTEPTACPDSRPT